MFEGKKLLDTRTSIDFLALWSVGLAKEESIPLEESEAL